MVLVRVSSPIVYETLPSRLRGPLCTTRTCWRRRLPVAATRTLVFPPLQGASWKIHDEEPERGDDKEPQDNHQELPDLRRQNIPLRRTRSLARYAKSIVHQGCIRRKRVTLISRHSDSTPIFVCTRDRSLNVCLVWLSSPRKVDRRPWEPILACTLAIASCNGSRLPAVSPYGCRAILPSCR
jgi:hypothetical protein